MDPIRTDHCLPISSYRDVDPGEVVIAQVRSSWAEFPEKTYFAQETFACFEVDQVSLCRWKGAPLILQSRDRGDRTDLASVDEILRLLVLPASVDLALTVRNVGSAPRRFTCGIVSHFSVVERRRDLLGECCGRRPRSHASWWWKDDHQRLVDLPEDEALRMDAALARCADGSPRRDLRHPWDRSLDDAHQ